MCLMVLCSINFVYSQQQTAEVTYLSIDDGVMKLRSVGYGKMKAECIKNAEKNAFEVLFFRGIPGSPQTTPLIGTNENQKSDNKAFFNELFNSGRYKTYIVSKQVNGYQKGKGYKRKAWVDIGINFHSLRRELEKEKIIGNFGIE